MLEYVGLCLAKTQSYDYEFRRQQQCQTKL